jgi:hypothetical protein
MKHGDIDSYISKFEELARRAGYTTGNPETTRIFMQGLPQSVVQDCLHSPPVHGYAAIKQRAIESTAAQRIIKDMFGGSTTTQENHRKPWNHSNNQGARTSFFDRMKQQGQNRFNNRPQGRPEHPYNSSNAPQWMVNRPVPMDLSRTRAPTNWRGGRNQYGRGGGRASVAKTNQGNNACFQCGEVGHFARNCPQKRRQQVNLIDFDPYGEPSPTDKAPEVNRVATVQEQITNMTFDEKMQFADSLKEEDDQDFLSA